MLEPKKVKFRRVHRGNRRGMSMRGNFVNFGSCIQYFDNYQVVLEKITNNIIHNVKDGENISIIFESYKIPLNTAYKIFRKDDKGLLTKILPGDQIKFKFVDNNLNSIEIKSIKADRKVIRLALLISQQFAVKLQTTTSSSVV